MRLDESDILFIFKDADTSLSCTVDQFLTNNPATLDVFKYVTNLFALYATELDYGCAGPESTTIDSLIGVLMPYFGEITKTTTSCAKASIIEAIMCLIQKNILHTTAQVDYRAELYDYIAERVNVPFSRFLKVDRLALVNIVNEGRNNKWENPDGQLRDEFDSVAKTESVDRIKSISVVPDFMENKTSENIPPTILTLNIPEGTPLNISGVVHLMKDLERLSAMNPDVVIITGRQGGQYND